MSSNEQATTPGDPASGSAGPSGTDSSGSGSSGDDKPRESLFQRLYTGTGAFQVVQRRRFWYLVSGGFIAICLLSILLRGFTFGIDFTGGTTLTMPADGVDDLDRVAVVVEEAIDEEPQNVHIVGQGAARIVEVETSFLTPAEVEDAKNALFDEYQPVNTEGEATIAAIGDSVRSESWGGQVTEQAIIALVVFLVLIFGYIAFRLEWQMAVGAIVALLFDLIATMGIYSLVGFEVTPATVIGVLTILGFSLYDTVVVFDKLKEHTRGFQNTTRYTYEEEANIAVNQTLMRSIHTTIIGLLPILALVFIAVWLLGVGTLRDLALVQIIGIVAGTFSSIFIAAPVLVTIKNRERHIREHTKRVMERRERQADGGAPNADDEAVVTA